MEGTTNATHERALKVLAQIAMDVEHLREATETGHYVYTDVHRAAQVRKNARWLHELINAEMLSQSIRTTEGNPPAA